MPMPDGDDGAPDRDLEAVQRELDEADRVARRLGDHLGEGVERRPGRDQVEAVGPGQVPRIERHAEDPDEREQHRQRDQQQDHLEDELPPERQLALHRTRGLCAQTPRVEEPAGRGRSWQVRSSVGLRRGSRRSVGIALRRFRHPVRDRASRPGAGRTGTRRRPPPRRTGGARRRADTPASPGSRCARTARPGS